MRKVFVVWNERNPLAFSSKLALESWMKANGFSYYQDDEGYIHHNRIENRFGTMRNEFEVKELNVFSSTFDFS